MKKVLLSEVKKEKNENSLQIVLVVEEGMLVVIKWCKLMALQLHAPSWLMIN